MVEEWKWMGTPVWRAIDFHEGDRIGRTALKALLRAAIAYNTTHSVPKSRGLEGLGFPTQRPSAGSV